MKKNHVFLIISILILVAIATLLVSQIILKKVEKNTIEHESGAQIKTENNDQKIANAYIKLIKELEEKHTTTYSFPYAYDLVDFDGDEIPELLVDLPEGSITLYTYKNENVFEIGMFPYSYAGRWFILYSPGNRIIRYTDPELSTSDGKNASATHYEKLNEEGHLEETYQEEYNLLSFEDLKGVKNAEEMIEQLQNNSFINTYSNPEEKTIKILLEYHVNHTGMPGPNGESSWGNSRFIASDGYVYEFEYNEYDDKTSYPNNTNLELLSKDLLSVAKKTDTELTKQELQLAERYIKIIESGEEDIEENINSETQQLPAADDHVTAEFCLYNYTSNKKIQISPDIPGQKYYESPSISRLYNLLHLYL